MRTSFHFGPLKFVFPAKAVVPQGLEFALLPPSFPIAPPKSFLFGYSFTSQL